MTMPRPLPRFLPVLVFATVLLAAARAQTGAAPAQEPASVFTDPARAANSADAPPAAKLGKPRRERVMSDDLAATLSVGMPKYTPPKPVEKKPADEPADAREADKPKNGIIRLPDYVVRETRPAVFKERDFATPNGKADIGMQRNAGLNFGPFASLNRPVALAMYYEQERLDNMTELADDAKTARRAGDKATSDYIMRQSQQTYLRADGTAPTYGLPK
ncbi:MAG: hypothetical protein JWM88_711 [Verrucomicrobia bacterium]|nr:hypothetical protein [Verrucomicrobiota bacterium]